MIEEIRKLLEKYRNHGILIDTDAIIFYVVSHKYLLLTDDFLLFQYVQSVKGDAVNFNHIRPLNWK